MKLVLGLGASLVLVSACTLGFDDFSFAPGTGGSAGDPTTSSGGSGTTTTGGGGTGGTTSGVGGSGTGTGTGTATGTGAGGTGGMAGAGGMGGLGGMMPTTVVACPDMANACDVSNGGKCCLAKNGPGAMCIPSGDCPDQAITVTCDEPGDCPGRECCGDFDFQNMVYDQLSCENSCFGANVIICDTNADCGPIDDCQASMVLPMGYDICI